MALGWVLFLTFNHNPKIHYTYFNIIIGFFSLSICHKHILQQEIKLHKVIKDFYIVITFIPKIH
jgi:Gpi18-like mannosyltransferase